MVYLQPTFSKKSPLDTPTLLDLFLLWTHISSHSHNHSTNILSLHCMPGTLLCIHSACDSLASSSHNVLDIIVHIYRLLISHCQHKRGQLWVKWDSLDTSSEIVLITYITQLLLKPKFLEILAATAAAKSPQSCPTLCDPIDGSPPGSPVPGILQARTLEWVAISFSNAWKWKVKVKSLSGVQLLVTPWTAASQAPPFMGFSRQEYWSGVPLPSPRDPCKTDQF